MAGSPQTCATCGKELREADEPQHTNGRCYCSAFCALHDEVSRTHQRATVAPAEPRA